MPPVLQVEQLALRRGGGFAIELPELTLAAGQVAALYGPSGVGKTSLLLGLAGLEGPAAHRRGRVRWFGRDLLDLTPVEHRRMLEGRVAWVMQDAVAALDPLLAIGRQLQQATGRTLVACAAALREFGVVDAGPVLARLPHQVSGGQAQRVLLSTAMLRATEVLIADEPSASLDDRNFDTLVANLQRLRDGGAAILLSTHDDRLIDLLQARVLVAVDGAFVPGQVDRRPWPTPAAAAAGRVPVLTARDLHLRLGGRPILAGVDFAMDRGEIVALVGESGIGKTTLARVLAGHLEADAGSVQRPARRAAVQLLFQDALASLTPGRRLGSLLAEARAPEFEPLAACRQLSLPPEVLTRTAAALSGGERRRAALLRALAVDPDVLILDEPTASLDRKAAVAVVQSLLQVREQRGLALLFITHDRQLAAAVATRVLHLREGKLWQ